MSARKGVLVFRTFAFVLLKTREDMVTVRVRGNQGSSESLDPTHFICGDSPSKQRFRQVSQCHLEDRPVYKVELELRFFEGDCKRRSSASQIDGRSRAVETSVPSIRSPPANPAVLICHPGKLFPPLSCAIRNS